MASLDDFQVMVIERVQRKRRTRSLFRDHGHAEAILGSYNAVFGLPNAVNQYDVAYVWETAELFLRRNKLWTTTLRSSSMRFHRHAWLNRQQGRSTPATVGPVHPHSSPPDGSASVCPMSKLTAWMDGKLYPGVSSNWDDELLRRRILDRLHPDMHVLDLGAGSGRVRQMNFRGLASKITGVDPDARILRNLFLDEAVTSSGSQIPFPDATFDMAVSDNVLEHLDNPAQVFKEVFRVLKPEGGSSPRRRTSIITCRS